MSDQSKAAGSGAPSGRRRLGGMVSALTALLMTWTIASSDVRAERIVLKSSEVIEGSIIDATRNTVIIRRSIGGMRQMRVQDIEEVRFDLAQGQEVAGQFLSWADGVYQVRSGDQIVRVSESRILSREPFEETARQVARGSPSQPMGERQITAAAAPPTPAAEPTALPGSAGQSPDERAGSAAAAGNNAVASAASSAAADEEPDTAAGAESQATANAQSSGAGDAESEPGDVESSAAGDAKSRAVAAAESGALAGDESAAVGAQGSPVVKASVDPPEPGARSMVFKIELSEPASQTMVLIYGTVDGTAKAGEDYEPQQGMVTLTPGAKSAEVRVPLIGGQPENGDKRFELVLMADPKVADIVDRRVTATIKGAD